MAKDGRRSPLLDAFSTLTDPRMDRTKHHLLIDIVVLAVCSVICGAETWEDVELVAQEKEVFFRRFLELPNGIPSHDTFERVFARLDPNELQQSFRTWTASVVELSDGEIIAIDGQRLRRSFDKSKKRAAIHMVSAWEVENKVVLAQKKIDDKSNEIPAMKELIDLLDVKGCIVTSDAMGCQQEIAEKIIKKEGDYVFGLKGNQGSTFEAAKQHFDTHLIAKSMTHETVDADHGRVETRLYKVADAKEIIDLKAWSGINTVIAVESKREIDDSSTTETRYYLSNLTASPQKVARAIRGHWGVENSLHWVLDVTVNQDRSRIRKDNGPENFAVLRHLAINLVKLTPTIKKRSIKGKRLKCLLNNDFLENVMFAGN